MKSSMFFGRFGFGFGVSVIWGFRRKSQKVQKTKEYMW